MALAKVYIELTRWGSLSNVPAYSRYTWFYFIFVLTDFKIYDNILKIAMEANIDTSFLNQI